MKINVTENKVSIKEEQILNENEYNIHKIQFDFSSEYTDDLVKVALFSIDNHTYKKIISNNECDIPPEVLTQRGYSILGVYAYKTEQDTLVLRYSPSPTRISVYDGSYKAEAENSEPITPSEIEQYQQILQNSLQNFQNEFNTLAQNTETSITEIEEELQRKVDEGYFDGEDGFSPIANVIQLSNGVKIEIEDKTGRTSASVFDGYSPQRWVDYLTEEDKQEVKEEATQEIDGKIEEYNENAAEKLNQYNQNNTQKINDYNTNAEQKVSTYNTNATEKLSAYNTNATEKLSAYNTNATEKISTYNSNAEQKETSYNTNASQKLETFNTNATNKLTEYNTNHTEKMSAYNSNSIQKLNAFNENATQKTEDFDEHTEEIQDNIEILQRTDNQILSRFNKDEEVSGQDITLTGTTEIKFAKPPLPMGNSEQNGEPSLDNEAPITNVTGDVEVVVQNKNLFDKDNSNILNYYMTSTGTIGASVFDKLFYINCNPSTTYTIQKIIGTSGRFRIGSFANIPSIGDEPNVFVVRDNQTTGVIMTGVNDKYLAVQYFASDSNEQAILDSIQVEKGQEKTDYIKGRLQTFTFPLGNEKLMLRDYLADDGIHHLRKQVTESGTTITLNDAKSDGAYLCNKKTAGNLVGKTLTFDTEVTDALIEYELQEEVIVPYTSAQQKVYNQIKNAYSYNEMTIITGSSDGNKPFFIVQAYKDLNKELNKNSNLVNGSNTGSLRSIGASDENSTYTMGTYAFAEGNLTKAEGFASHAEGTGTTANGDNQHVQGKNNIEDDNNKYAHIVGNGQDYQHPSNAHTVDWQGNGWFQGNVKVGGTSQDDTNAQNLITEVKYNRLKATLPTTGEVTGQAITLNKTAELEFVKPPLPMGNSEQDGEPSPTNEVPINNVTGDVEVVVQNKNFFNGNSSNFNASWDGGDANKLTLLADGNIQTTANYSFWRAKAIDIKSLKPNTKYTLSIELISATSTQTSKAVIRIPYNNGTSGGYVDFNGNENLYQFNSLGKQTFTFTTPSDMVHIGLSLNSDGSDTTAVFGNIMIEKGSSATTYVAHKEQKFIFPLSNEKLMLGDYLADDGIHQASGEYTFTGNENWLDYSESQTGDFYKFYSTNVKLGRTNYMEASNTAYCTHFESNKFYGNQNGFGLTRNATYISIDKTLASTPTELKTWFATQYNNGNSVKIQYTLATEKIIPYTSAQQTAYNQIKQALSYEEQTNISSNQNAIFNVVAYQSIKLILEDISNAIVALGGV